MTARHLPLPVACAALLLATGLPPVHAHPAAAPRGAAAASCADSRREARLLKRETAMLGHGHAAEHAQARLYRCRVLQGLEHEEPGPAKAMLAAHARPEPDGKWSAPFELPIAGISSVLLHNGKILFWAYDPGHWEDPNTSTIGVSYVWDPATRTGHPVPTPENIWCGGQTILADGRVFVAGGNLRFPDPKAPKGQQGWEGDASTYVFDPATETFITQPEMAHGRWYPTVTQLPDNSAIITSGYDETGSEHVNELTERFVPSESVGGLGLLASVASKPTPGTYPFQYVLPSGAMLQAGPQKDNSWLLDPAGWTWSKLPHMRSDHIAQGNGITYTDASVQPVRQTIVVAGGMTPRSNNEWLDGYNPQAGWRAYPTWNIQRHNANTIILPDGTLLTIGGNKGNSTYNDTLYSAEHYSVPADNVHGEWTEVAPNELRAAYHSSAILLPDATVLLSEDDREKTVEAAAHHKFQVYSPAYLFKGERPTLSAPAAARRGTAFDITATAAPKRTIAGAVLIAPGAVTHGNDMHQRFIKLPVRVDGDRISATVPDSAALVPPGYYMLFVVDSQGVPSVASFVHIA
jgi:hypothetical protein